MATRFQELLAEYFRDQARWRQFKSKEFPDDERNIRAAYGLLELADYVLALSTDDERLANLQRANDRLGGELAFEPGENANYDISRFRVHNPNEDCAAFFNWLVGIVPASIDNFISLYGDEQ